MVVASVGLGLFAFRHVEYSSELWWRFEVEQDAPRFLRATVGVLVALSLVGCGSCCGRRRPRCSCPATSELADAAPRGGRTAQDVGEPRVPRDKALLWNEARTAFLMYGVQGRTWVALGDPVGPRGAAELLVKALPRAVRRLPGRAGVLRGHAEWLHVYADFGLTFAKLGEEARVSLPHFALEGGGTQEAAHDAQPCAREAAARSASSSRPRDQPALMPELRAVSNEWLADKAAAEKGLLARLLRRGLPRAFPVAIIERRRPHRGVRQRSGRARRSRSSRWT